MVVRHRPARPPATVGGPGPRQGEAGSRHGPCDADTCGHVSSHGGPRATCPRPGCGHHTCRVRRVPGPPVERGRGVRCPLSAVRCPGPALSSPPRPDWRPAATSSHQQPPAASSHHQILTAAAPGSGVRGVFSSRSFSDTLLDVTGGQVPRRRVTAAARRPPHSRPRPGRCSLGWAGTGSAEVLSRTDRAAQLGPPPTPELTVS